MPVGPSHSRGGSSRSSGPSGFGRSSGGFSSSRSSYSSPSRSRSSHHTTVVYTGGGGGYYGGIYVKPMSPKAKKITALVFGVIFCLIIGLVGAFKFVNNIGTVSLMRQDAREYAQIIKKAQKGEDGYYLAHFDLISSGSGHTGYEIYYKKVSPDRNFSATAYNYVYKNGVEYFYLEYEFTDTEGRRISGETYTCYSENAVQGLSEITIAYTKNFDNDGSWDSMDINYKLSNNMDYWLASRNTLSGLGMAVVFLGLTALFIYMIVRISQNKPIFKKANAVEQAKEEVRIHRTCKHCGSIVRPEVVKCPSCGSGQFYEPTTNKKTEEKTESEE